jgi:hypothetical protein
VFDKKQSKMKKVTRPDDLPGPVLDPELERLLAEEERLEAEAQAERFAASGLKDLDGELAIVEVKLRLALRLMEAARPDHALIRDKALGAARRLEELQEENLSEEQRGLVTAAPGYVRARELFQSFILRGGGGYLEPEEPESRKARLVAGAVVGALRKHLESAPVGGIAEGEELTYSSPRMQLPLSQAIRYLETELLPELESSLAADPGNAELQARIRDARSRLANYRGLRFAPRSTPIVIEKGFYTEWWTGFSADGEMLVSIPLPVRFRSGTNLDRLRDLVRAEVVRRLAGRRVCPALDREYRFRRSLESGRAGSTRLPGFKLDTRRGFAELKGLYPGLKRIENKQELAALAELASGENRQAAVKALLGLMKKDKPTPPLLA